MSAHHGVLWRVPSDPSKAPRTVFDTTDANWWPSALAPVGSGLASAVARCQRPVVSGTPYSGSPMPELPDVGSPPPVEPPVELLPPPDELPNVSGTP